MSANALKLSTAQLAAIEDQIIEADEGLTLLVVSEVLARLGHKAKARKAREDSRIVPLKPLPAKPKK